MLSIDLDDHVAIKGDRTGYIRYVGHLDDIGKPSAVFVGLELDAKGKKIQKFTHETEKHKSHKMIDILETLFSFGRN